MQIITSPKLRTILKSSNARRELIKILTSKESGTVVVEGKKFKITRLSTESQVAEKTSKT
jgi:hypothetical protein